VDSYEAVQCDPHLSMVLAYFSLEQQRLVSEYPPSAPLPSQGPPHKEVTPSMQDWCTIHLVTQTWYQDRLTELMTIMLMLSCQWLSQSLIHRLFYGP